MQEVLMEESRRVLVIDDDSRMQTAIQDFLQANGYAVNNLMNGSSVLEGIELYRPDIILLDIMMPGEDGLAVLRRIRTVSGVPVIMVTAKGEDMDRVIGLELGADDYLPKPFLPRELLARIKAVLRRAAGDELKNYALQLAQSDFCPQNLSPFSPTAPAAVSVAPYLLDLKRQRLKLKDRSSVLSTAEFCLIYALMVNAGQVLSREQLQNLAFCRDDYAGPRNIDVHISRIRSMLGKMGDKAVRIRTVWGRGYCWVQEEGK